MSFSSIISQFASDATIDIVEQSAEIARDVLSATVRYSPVNTGRFVANWHLGTSSSTSPTEMTMSRDSKIGEINSLITNDYFLRNVTIVMSNPLDYAHNVEYDGWRRTGPYAPRAEALVYARAKYTGA